MPRNKDEAIDAMAHAIASSPEIKAFLDGLKAGHGFEPGQQDRCPAEH